MAKARIAKLLVTPPVESTNVNMSASLASVSIASSTVSCDPNLFLSALTTALQFGTLGPPAAEPLTGKEKGGQEPESLLTSPVAGGGAHSWKIMANVCMELVECYGNTRLDFDSPEEINRLKMASLYLITACKLKNQYAVVLKSPLKLCTVTSSGNPAATPMPLSEPLTSKHLIALLNSFTSSSSTASYVTRVDKENSLNVSTASSGRDALCFVSSIVRERDELWQDGVVYDACIDTHHLLRVQYPSYNASCCLSAAALPSLSSELAVPVGGVYSYWLSMNEPIPEVSDTPKTSPMKASMKATIVDPEARSLFNNFTGYFLLGFGADGTTSEQPFLTKVVLHRKEVVSLEQDFRDLRTQLAKAVINTVTGLKDSCNTLGSLCCNIVRMVSVSNKTKATAKFESIEISESAMEVEITVTPNHGDSSSCKLSLSDATILLLGNCFTNGTCVDSVVDSSVCTFLRLALLGSVE